MTQNRFKDNPRPSIPFEIPSSDFSIEILVFTEPFVCYCTMILRVVLCIRILTK